jgi:alkylated DNA repair protein (DNA oxidative demethylase)
MEDLFEIPLPEGVTLLRGRTSLREQQDMIAAVATQSPWRQLSVRSGAELSVRSTNAGEVGWYSDRYGYRYEALDPLTGQCWPQMPASWRECACQWAAEAGFPNFRPDCCLLNQYAPGARMGAHRDHDEIDFEQPIVSVSLGLPATFVWYGHRRTGRGFPLELRDGDVVVFGGPARRGFHAVRPVQQNGGPFGYRINLTFRRAR